MERTLSLVFALAAAGALALSLAGAVPPARACSLAPFSVKYLPDNARASDVVAIGTLGDMHGATIDFEVETYFKAPTSRAGTLVVNNLSHSTTPSCEPVPLHLLAFEPGTRVLALLTRDNEAVGANWRPGLSGGFTVIEDDAVRSWREDETRGEIDRVPIAEVKRLLAEATAPEQPPNRAVIETRPPVLWPEKCLYGPYNLRYFAAAAPIIALGTVESADAFTAMVRVETGYLGAAAGGLLKVDNRYPDAGHAISTCEEKTGPGPKFNVGDQLLMFLRAQEASDLVGLRAAGVDGYGIYPKYDRWGIYDGQAGPLTLDQASAVIRDVVARRPATAERTPGAATSEAAGKTATHVDDRTPLWAIGLVAVAAGAAGGAAATLLASRVRRSPR